MKRLKKYFSERLDVLLGVFEAGAMVVKTILVLVFIAVFCFLCFYQEFIFMGVILFVANVFLLSYHDRSLPADRLMIGVFMFFFGMGMILFPISVATTPLKQKVTAAVAVFGLFFASLGSFLTIFAYRAISNMQKRTAYLDVDPIDFLARSWDEPE
jgi:hypothetical protein